MMSRSIDAMLAGSEAAGRNAKSTKRGVASFLAEPEQQVLFCPIVSVDDHALEPADVFTSRVPRRLRDDVPRLEPDAEGVPYWVIDDDRFGIVIGNGAVGRPMDEWTLAPQRYDEFRSGVWDPTARVRDMDLSGVWASLNFPSLVWGFAGTRFSKMRDPEIGLASLKAYNDWVLEEWCASHPERFIPCQLPWLADPAVAAQEIQRNSSRGCRAVSFSENPHGSGFPEIYSDHWDPFFAACEETGTVLNLHVGSSGDVIRPSPSSPAEVPTALFPLCGVMTVVDWIYAKIPVRFPDLKIVLSEAGASWVPMVIERLRRAHRQREASVVWSATDPDPIDLLRRNFFFASIEDPAAFSQIDEIGDTRLMLEMDYPHFDSTWPGIQELVSDEMSHLPAATVHRVCYENACLLYHHAAPPEELIRTSTIGAQT